MSRTDAGHWLRAWLELGRPGTLRWHGRLLEAYAEPRRHYHTLEHLRESLLAWDALRHFAREPALVELALWFHDAVYDPRSIENEEASAGWAVQCLGEAGAPEDQVQAARDLVLATKHHEPGAHVDAALLIDVDLSILGKPAGRFWEYEHAIRAEYAWVPAETFQEKRREILQRFLQRPTIYRTPAARERYEASARENLSAAIARLGQREPIDEREPHGTS